MAPALEMRNITKRFSDTTVLSEVNFIARKGEVHALIGENGAGKSTLMKILSGVLTADSGEILLNGEEACIRNPKDAQELGISMIYQETRLFADLSVMENVFIRREPVQGSKWFSRIDWKKAAAETQRYLTLFGLRFHPRTPVGQLGAAEQKFVEIIRALSQNARIVVMDEPTAALTDHEIETLFGVIRELRALGVTVIYISHRLEEIKLIADEVTVLRDGRVVQTSAVGDVNLHDIIRVMIGRNVEDRYPKLKVPIGEVRLSVANLNYGGLLNQVSFDVRRGEVFGITGLTGSGRRTLAKVLFGINQPFEGRICINGREFHRMSPNLARRVGFCYVPGIGSEEALVSHTSVGKNVTLTHLKRISRWGFLRMPLQHRHANDLIRRLDIEAKETDIADTLSGGNQKKAVFAKWLFANAHVLLIDEPTAGIDISSKIDIYNIINELVHSGAAVVLISSDLPELIGMCDRIAVMVQGEIRRVFERGEATHERILHVASGERDEA